MLRGGASTSAWTFGTGRGPNGNERLGTASFVVGAVGALTLADVEGRVAAPAVADGIGELEAVVVVVGEVEVELLQIRVGPGERDREAQRPIADLVDFDRAEGPRLLGPELDRDR